MDNCNDIAIRKKVERLQLFMIGTGIGVAMIGYLLMSRAFSWALISIYKSLGYETYVKLINSSIFQNVVYLFYAFFCVIVPFLAAHIIIKRIVPAKLNYRRMEKNGGIVPLMFVGLGVCVLGNYATAIFTIITESFFSSTPTGAPSDVTSASQISLAGFFVSVLSTAIVPALVEEFSIRGVVMQPLRRFGDKFAVVISAVVFAIIHGNFQQIPFALVVGFALGYVVIRTGSIWAGVILHSLNNFWAVCSEYLYYLVPMPVYLAVYYGSNLIICVGAIISAIYLYKRDVKCGMTEGALVRPQCLLPLWQKIIMLVCSPVFLYGAGRLLYGALQNFVAV